MNIEKEFPELEGLKLNKILRIDVNYDVYMDKDIQKHYISKKKVREELREFVVKEIEEIRKEWPNFAYTTTQMNQAMINQINIVLSHRRTKLGIEE